MRIMVVGDGRVGHTLAEHLTQEGHDVVVIDKSGDVLRRTEDALDVLCVRGNGANAQTLINAGVDRADIIIACTASDEINMLCSLIAKRLGCKYAIARIRDPEYHESQLLLQRELGIDLAINPERATALEISRLLRFPYASNIESFAGGKIEMVEFRAQEGDAMCDVPLREVAKQHHSIPKVLYAAVDREGEVCIPNGEFIIRPGDRVHVAGEPATITEYFRYLGRNSLRIKHVMMIGGSRIAYYLAKLIVPIGFHVSLLEIDHDNAALLSEILPGVKILLGDGSDKVLLEEEGLQDMDALVTLSNHDEENLMTGLYAVKQGVPKVIVKNNSGIYSDIIAAMGLDSIVSPKAITCTAILRYVRARVNSAGTGLEKLYRLMNDKAEALEFVVRQDDSCVGIPLKDLHMIDGTLVCVIVRNGKVIVPFGNDHMEVGDDVLIVSQKRGISALNEVFRK